MHTPHIITINNKQLKHTKKKTFNYIDNSGSNYYSVTFCPSACKSWLIKLLCQFCDFVAQCGMQSTRCTAKSYSSCHSSYSNFFVPTNFSLPFFFTHLPALCPVPPLPQSLCFTLYSLISFLFTVFSFLSSL